MRILELAPFNGYWTKKLSKYCDQVVAIEGRKVNCDYIESLKIPNLTIIHANLESYDIKSLGYFDIIVAKGILYHLTYPWIVVRQICQMTNYIIGWSHYAEVIEGEIEGYHGKIFYEPSDKKPPTWKPEDYENFQKTIHPSGLKMRELTAGLS